MDKPKVSMIVAVAKKDRAIGKDNRLLWSIPEDLKRFKEITLGHPVIMGENTYRSIGRPLSGRTNIILTDKKDSEIPGCSLAYSVEEALDQAKALDQEEVFVIGGASVYRQMLPSAERLYLTEVEGDFEADTFFPPYDEFRKVVSEEKHSNGTHDFSFLILERA